MQSSVLLFLAIILQIIGESTNHCSEPSNEIFPFSGFPYFFGLSEQVISGIETAVRSMKVGGLRRVIIPPSQGYQNTSQEPLPPNV
ncbi:hypothetical protein H5410_007152 [Solanum commersonii]|uniref:peptidylprolyl isomerase n=1 Tax=Solanum commersonii TaxID=4109 RepID=A0A9J6AB52_SOLCO|nr:hypothetical protein H5410_007152 [Solanum commersonii]